MIALARAIRDAVRGVPIPDIAATRGATYAVFHPPGALRLPTPAELAAAERARDGRHPSGAT